jgi:hypothetical protein
MRVVKTTKWKKNILKLNDKFSMEQQKISNNKLNKIISNTNDNENKVDFNDIDLDDLK